MKDFAFAADEPVGEGIKRLACAQVDVILAGLGSLDAEAVHEIRKATQRLRGLVRLARDEPGDTLGDDHDLAVLRGLVLEAYRDHDDDRAALLALLDTERGRLQAAPPGRSAPASMTSRLASSSAICTATGGRGGAGRAISMPPRPRETRGARRRPLTTTVAAAGQLGLAEPARRRPAHEMSRFTAEISFRSPPTPRLG
jgi:hypothetical protein